MADLHELCPESPASAAEIDDLLDRVFGSGRVAKTAERLREGRLPAHGLSFVAREHGRLIGTIRFWHVGIGVHPGQGHAAVTPALLLGPLAVDSTHHHKGLGATLIRKGLLAATARGHAAVILVGDPCYYQRFGFSAGLTRAMVLPGPVDRSRFLGLELQRGALARAAGLVHATGLLDPNRGRLRAA